MVTKDLYTNLSMPWMSLSTEKEGGGQHGSAIGFDLPHHRTTLDQSLSACSPSYQEDSMTDKRTYSLVRLSVETMLSTRRNARTIESPPRSSAQIKCSIVPNETHQLPQWNEYLKLRLNVFDNTS